MFIKKTVEGLTDYIARNYSGKVVEVGVGWNFSTSDELEARSLEVVRTDVRRTREDVLVDDICNPRLEVYSGASLIYSIRPPYEVQICILRVAEAVGCDAIILPLKGEIVEGGRLVSWKGSSFYIFTPRSRKAPRER
ncbi:Uncharacterized protein conserved in archaea [Geoglobus ahangari]|uniref:UPF0146 protein GAH_00944 n=1 Tax=Geoglobus ahangari TaxID=113653 RepID=A0A0F7IGG9_9EURY|nr:Uncharacterized protein conserved in archaea [Geoglobus ahangari]